MGSFNIKCGVSGQVIAEGEKCRIAVILQAATYNPVDLTYRDNAYALYGVRNSCGPDYLWVLQTGFMSGTYDDYGKVSLDKTSFNQCVLAELFNRLYRHAATTQAQDEEGLRRGMPFDFKALIQEKAPKLQAQLSAQKNYYDSLDPAALDFAEALELWDSLQDAVIQNRVFCADGNQVLRPLQLTAVHDVAFKHLVHFAEGLKWFDGRSYAREDYFARAFAKLHDELANLDNDLIRFVKKDTFRESLHLQMDSSLTQVWLWACWRTIEAGVNAVIDEGRPISAFLELCREPLDALYAVKGIAELNITLLPIAYAGQDYDNETGRRYADFVAGASEEICAARRARYGEDE